VGVNCQQNEFVRLEISDQGADLSVDERELIFEPFRQTQQFTNGQVERPSLGLAICKSIVEAHQGAIGVTSDEAGNCTFWIQIPTATIPIS
jgi:signal transduction histidine kinase